MTPNKTDRVEQGDINGANVPVAARAAGVYCSSGCGVAFCDQPREIPMPRMLLITTAALAALLGPAHAQGQSPAALTGTVTSAAEGAMEGVVVSAKKGIVTMSVVSDAKGAFSFPASKL